jgi:hypothetical protein
MAVAPDDVTDGVGVTDETSVRQAYGKAKSMKSEMWTIILNLDQR